MFTPLVLISAALAFGSLDGPGAPSRELRRLASEARNADLRGDWSGLMRAHDAVATLAAAVSDRAWADYYLGYIDWRESSLASMGQGRAGATACLEQAATHLSRALEEAPAFVEARLLLVIVHGGIITSDPPRAGDLTAPLRSNAAAVFAEAPGNPRVKFLKAFMGFYAPGRTREQKDAARADWRSAAESFPARPPANEPEWGRAEAWAWLGGTLLVDGKPDQAKDALEHALTIRKDFWWARQIALPQATRMQANHNR